MAYNNNKRIRRKGRAKQIRGNERTRLGDLRPSLIQERVDPMIRERKAQRALEKTRQNKKKKKEKQKNDKNGKTEVLEFERVSPDDIEIGDREKRSLRRKARKKTPLIPKGLSSRGRRRAF